MRFELRGVRMTKTVKKKDDGNEVTINYIHTYKSEDGMVVTIKAGHKLSNEVIDIDLNKSENNLLDADEE